MKVLVTGAAGNLGRWVVDACAASGHTVTGTDRVPVPAGVRSGPRGERAERHVVADITGAGEDLSALLYGAEAVVHCAALPGPLAADAPTVFTHNVSTTYRVLHAAAAAGARHAVLLSSMAALGMPWAPRPFPPAYLPADEDHPLAPQDAYSLSKVVDERTAAMFAAHDVPAVTVLRMPAILHPHHVLDPDRPGATGAERLTQELFGYVDVRDAAASVTRALQARPPGCVVLNVAAADTRSRLPSAELAARHYPGTPLRRPLRGHEGLYAVDRAAALIGHTPRHSWRDGTPDAPGTPGAPDL